MCNIINIIEYIYKKICKGKKKYIPLHCILNSQKMKKVNILLLVCAFIAFLSSCTSVKNIPYLKNVEEIDLTASRMLYDAKIMPKDQLTIYINTTDPAASEPFNLYSQRQGGGGASQTIPYLVDNNGFINFPVLGKLKVAGMTKTECQDMIASRMKMYLSESEIPVVTVQMSSYHVTVMGEVATPSVIPVTTEKISILEAIASAGDLTIYGHRDNIMLIREDARGEKSVHRINLNDASIINSPYYYLQQNDIIYVEPQKIKAKNSFFNQYTSLYFSLVSMLMTAATFIIQVIE